MKKTLFGASAAILLASGLFATSNLTAREIAKHFKAEPDPATCTLENLDQAGIGDVKYSVLSESDFQKVNGTEWVLLNGEVLANLTYPGYDEANGTIESIVDAASQSEVYEGDFVSLPDARGVFLRGADAGSGNNPSPTKLGEYQGDQFQSHKHQFGNSTSGENGQYGGRYYSHGTAGSGKYVGSPVDDGNEVPRVGTETRSKNVTVNTFVKIRRGCIDQALEDKFAAFQTQIDNASAAVQALKCGPVDVVTYPSGCFELPETNETEKHAKVTCLDTGLKEWEIDNNLKFWSHNCLIQTVATAKRILISIGEPSQTEPEKTFFAHIVITYPYYNDVSWKAETK